MTYEILDKVLVYEAYQKCTKEIEISFDEKKKIFECVYNGEGWKLEELASWETELAIMEAEELFKDIEFNPMANDKNFFPIVKFNNQWLNESDKEDLKNNVMDFLVGKLYEEQTPINQ